MLHKTVEELPLLLKRVRVCGDSGKKKGLFCCWPNGVIYILQSPTAAAADSEVISMARRKHTNHHLDYREIMEKGFETLNTPNAFTVTKVTC